MSRNPASEQRNTAALAAQLSRRVAILEREKNPVAAAAGSSLASAAAIRFSQSIPDDSATSITLTHSSGTADWATSDSSIFSLNSGSLEIGAEGVYLFHAWAHMVLFGSAPSGTSPIAMVELGSDLVEGTSVGVGPWFEQIGTANYMARPEYVGFGSWSVADGFIPEDQTLTVYQRSGGTITNVNCGVTVAQIASTALGL